MSSKQILQASEILEMAVQLERRGIVFYRVCAAASQKADVRDLFEFMIVQEGKHIEIFSKMKEDLGDDYHLPESYPGEIRSYLNSFLEGQVFLSSEEAADMATRKMNLHEAVDMAIEFEKAAIL